MCINLFDLECENCPGRGMKLGVYGEISRGVGQSAPNFSIARRGTYENPFEQSLVFLRIGSGARIYPVG